MKIVLVSGFLNKHLIELVKYFKQNSEFYFISTEDYSGKTQFEYARDVIEDSCNIEYFKEENKEFCKKLIVDCDVAIFGGNSYELRKERQKTDKLSFLYSERMLKKSLFRRFIPKTRKTILESCKGNMRILCASAYLPLDLSLLKQKNECYKWGYFPKTYTYDIEELIKNKTSNSILWAGRMIKLKHPEKCIKVAKALNKQGVDFILNMVGDGPEKKKIEKLIEKNGLKEKIKLLGKKTTEEVREIMEKSEIFMFTSNKREGWGAVSNEAMNSGCVLVGASVIGSVPFLIEDRENGVIYNSKSDASLIEEMEYLLQDKNLRNYMGKMAYLTIINYYNAEIAVKRLIKLCQSILDGEEEVFVKGVLSKAEVIKEKYKIF